MKKYNYFFDIQLARADGRHRIRECSLLVHQDKSMSNHLESNVALPLVSFDNNVGFLSA